MSHQVPRIDLRTAGADELVAALMQHSCVFLEGHGVPRAALADMLATWDVFSAFPREEKAKVEWPGDGPWYGWQPVSEEGPVANLMERFELRFEAKLFKPDREAWADTFTRWPAAPAEFRPAWTELYFALRGLTSRVMTMLAEGTGRSDEDLTPWTTNQHSNLVANLYHAQEAQPNAGQWRAFPHTDIGAITLLWADHAPGGLEVAINGGKDWVSVLIPDDVWLLQAGDLLNLWTGGRIPANKHRVANPPREQASIARRSIVYFHHPDPSIVVAPPAGDARNAVSAEAHILERQRLDYAEAQALASIET